MALSSIDWQAFGGELTDFDDGHTPETVSSSTKLVNYPLVFSSASSPEVHVYSNAMPEQLVDRIYQKTMEESLPSWGDYVTLNEIQEYWDQPSDATNHHETDSERHAIIEMTARYLQMAPGKSEISPRVIRDGSSSALPSSRHLVG